jgi:hypothetical protein
MRAGERRNGGFEDVPLLSAASVKTQRLLSEHVERLALPDRSLVAARGRPVQWVTIAVGGTLTSGGQTWTSGDAVFLAEGLLHDVAPETVRTRGAAEVALVPIRALTAAMSTDAGFSLAVARSIAGVASPLRHAVRLDHRHCRGRTPVRPAA